MTERLPNGRFPKGVSGNKKGRPPGKSKAAEIRAAFEEDWPKAVERIKQLALEGDAKLLMYWASQVCPLLKPVDVPITVSGIQDAHSLIEMGHIALRAALNGEVTIAEGMCVAQACLRLARTSESTIQEEQINQLQEQVKKLQAPSNNVRLVTNS